MSEPEDFIEDLDPTGMVAPMLHCGGDALNYLAASTGLGQVLQPIVGAFAKNWIPSKADRANLDLRKKEVSLREEELEMRERHYLMQIAENRKNILRQLESQQTLAQYQDLLRRWPLAPSPITILRASERRNSYALNMVLLVVDGNEEEFYRGSGRIIKHTMDMLSRHALPMAQRAAEAFEMDMVCYHQTLKGSALTGDSLRATLSVLLATEPTVLIEIGILETNQVLLQICHWGFPADRNQSFTTHPTKTVRLAPLPTPSEADDLKSRQAWDRQYQEIAYGRALTVGTALAALVVSIGDAFRALQRPHTFPDPILLSMMKDPTFGLLTTGAKVPASVWPPLVEICLSIYDGVANLNKSLASELAAKAACAAYKAQQPEFAKRLLEKALHLHPYISRIDEAQIMAQLRRQRRGRQPSELENALTLINSLVIEKSASRQTDTEIASYFGPPK